MFRALHSGWGASILTVTLLAATFGAHADTGPADSQGAEGDRETRRRVCVGQGVSRTPARAQGGCPGNTVLQAQVFDIGTGFEVDLVATNTDIPCPGQIFYNFYIDADLDGQVGFDDPLIVGGPDPFVTVPINQPTQYILQAFCPDLGCSGTDVQFVDPFQQPGGPGAARNLQVLGYDVATGEMVISYQPACGASDHNIESGPLDAVGDYIYFDQVCEIGDSGNATITFEFPDFSEFFLVVGTDGQGFEGPYGTNSLGELRLDNPSDFECGYQPSGDLGACCLGNTCEVTSEACCLAQGGEFNAGEFSCDACYFCIYDVTCVAGDGCDGCPLVAQGECRGAPTTPGDSTGCFGDYSSTCDGDGCCASLELRGPGILQGPDCPSESACDNGEEGQCCKRVDGGISCEKSTRTCCEADGGGFIPTVASCPNTGTFSACCFDDGSGANSLQGCCDALGGTWSGAQQNAASQCCSTADDCDDDNNECTDVACVNNVCTYPPKTSGTSCGSSTDDDCDNPDTCDGLGNCASNFETSGTACTDDNNVCTNDICDGTGTCDHDLNPDYSLVTLDIQFSESLADTQSIVDALNAVPGLSDASFSITAGASYQEVDVCCPTAELTEEVRAAGDVNVTLGVKFNIPGWENSFKGTAPFGLGKGGYSYSFGPFVKLDEFSATAGLNGQYRMQPCPQGCVAYSYDFNTQISLGVDIKIAAWVDPPLVGELAGKVEATISGTGSARLAGGGIIAGAGCEPPFVAGFGPVTVQATGTLTFSYDGVTLGSYTPPTFTVQIWEGTL